MEKEFDGHTYYYLIDEVNILHICSNGRTRCGKDAMKYAQASDDKLKLYELCAKCQLPPKKATFTLEVIDISEYNGADI
jgi:hypothetical protein